METKYIERRTAKMKRLLVVCEGPTEQEFCNCTLAPHLLSHKVLLSAPVVKKSNGGIVPWTSLRQQILNHLREEGIYVSMLIDYYGIKDHYEFPGWEESKAIANKTDRVHFLIDKMIEDIPSGIRYRFLPYIQMHEFEGLLFSDFQAILSIFSPQEANLEEIKRIITEYPNPEEINNSPETAPSKRLIKTIPGYNKIVYGNIIADQIGLQKIREKCPLFNEWLIKLEEL